MAKNIFSGLFGKRKEDEAVPGAETAETPGSEAVAPTEAPAPRAEASNPGNGLFARLRAGLSKTSSRLSDGVAAIFTKQKLDERTLDDFEDLLIAADLGVAAAGRIRETLARERYDKDISAEEIRRALAAEVAGALKPLEKPLVIDRARKPHVILTVGVNGAGKTTTIGKLAAKFKDEGLSVMLAAGDTFRAAAVEQLVVWGERTGAPVVRRDIGADAAGLAYDALASAKKDGVDVLIVDTAGRLQNKRALMDELAKIVRVLKKLDPDAPHDVLLVLDATVGQNALGQAEAFREIAGVTGLVMTKLDGTARGGVLAALADKFAIPIHFIGVGEGVEDLQIFRAESFARALAGLENRTGEESR
ncbi:MAG: signal recognition particle-docking protein FtsY [Parvularculaceae bacterium]